MLQQRLPPGMSGANGPLNLDARLDLHYLGLDWLFYGLLGLRSLYYF